MRDDPEPQQSALDLLRARIAELEQEKTISDRINEERQALLNPPLRPRDSEIKLDSISHRLHPGSSLEQRTQWLDELDYLFEASPQRYATDKNKIAAGFFCVEAYHRAQWTNHKKTHFVDIQPTWSDFEDWSLEFIRGGRFTEADIAEKYHAARQRSDQDPRQFHNYLQSIENHMDFTEKQRAQAYFAKLIQPLKKEIKALYQNELPDNRTDMVTTAIRTWDSRDFGHQSNNTRIQHNSRKRRRDDQPSHNQRNHPNKRPQPGHETNNERSPNPNRIAIPRQQRGSSERKDLSHITCHKCHKKGHYANTCPQRDNAPLAAQINEITLEDSDQENFSESE
jgi:hypothetical protein